VEAELAAKAAALQQEISYERRVPKPENRDAPADLYAKLPVKETVVIEPDEVKAEPEAVEQICEERTFEVEDHPAAGNQARDRARPDV
jgi:hypothetical protein